MIWTHPLSDPFGTLTARDTTALLMAERPVSRRRSRARCQRRRGVAARVTTAGAPGSCRCRSRGDRGRRGTLGSGGAGARPSGSSRGPAAGEAWPGIGEIQVGELGGQTSGRPETGVPAAGQSQGRRLAIAASRHLWRRPEPGLRETRSPAGRLLGGGGHADAGTNADLPGREDERGVERLDDSVGEGSAAAGPGRFSRRIANSSPPNRAAVSPSRTA